LAVNSYESLKARNERLAEAARELMGDLAKNSGVNKSHEAWVKLAEALSKEQGGGK